MRAGALKQHADARQTLIASARALVSSGAKVNPTEILILLPAPASIELGPIQKERVRTLESAVVDVVVSASPSIFSVFPFPMLDVARSISVMGTI